MIIREALAEQVVGYEPPKGSDEEESSDDSGYLGVGDMGVDASTGSEKGKQYSGQQVRTLTKKRQSELNKGDAVDADETGQELGMARSMRG
tara:strand:- start:1058 stop:1330 length:273 start_codon:yes stop_codon:yes gene_type:complete